ncbi:unnamed protein product [Sphagnum troendelagicum]|uniref:Uncharacterized protein n=1 Tax=Sphagnum troendelagicum TaxID=128251 RepID=A0ABP0TQD3_9BRYO
MQIARVISRRLSPSFSPSCCGTRVPTLIFRFPAVRNQVDLFKTGRPGFHSTRLLSTVTRLWQDTHLRSFKQFPSAVGGVGERCHVMKILGLTTTIYLSSWQQSPKTLICEGIEQPKTTDLSIKETVISTDEKENAGFFERLKWLKWLWVPMLVLLSVSMGSRYPVPVVVAVGFLLWSTKPHPASIYNWVEKRRLQDTLEKWGANGLKSRLKAKATVMHVEVRDYMFFCLARVTSITQNATMVGIFGGWWVLYSSSSSITAVGLSSLLPTPPPILSKYLQQFESEILDQAFAMPS